MKKRFMLGVMLLFIWQSCLQGATRGDVKVLEAADSIRYSASKLTKEYLLYLLYPKKKVLLSSLQERFRALDSDMHDIAISTKDPKTKGVLKYFAYEKVRIEEILFQDPSRENAQTLLDFSESFVEGATAIAKRHVYVPAPEEEMWILTRSLDQDIEEIIKYYIAHDVIRDDPELKRKLSAAVSRFEKVLAKINQYEYDGEIKTARSRLNHLWQTLGTYLSKADKLPLPIIATLMGDQIESSIDALGVFHSKNQ